MQRGDGIDTARPPGRRLGGIAEAEGSLLVFVDDDNILAPDYLERAAAIPVTAEHFANVCEREQSQQTLSQTLSRAI